MPSSKRRQRQRLAVLPSRIARSRVDVEACPVRAHVLSGRVQRAIVPQELQHPRCVGLRHLAVQRTLANALAQQLGNIAARVVVRLPLYDRLAAVGAVALQQRAARAVHLHLQLYAELATVAQHRLMRGRQAPCTRVLVLLRPKAAYLAGAIREVDGIAAAHRPVAAARTLPRLQHGAAVAQRRQLVGGHHPGDPRAQDDHLFPIPQPRGRCNHPLRSRGFKCRQAHRLHTHKGRARAAHLPHPRQKRAPAQAHLLVLFVCLKVRPVYRRPRAALLMRKAARLPLAFGPAA